MYYLHQYTICLYQPWIFSKNVLLFYIMQFEKDFKVHAYYDKMAGRLYEHEIRIRSILIIISSFNQSNEPIK